MGATRQQGAFYGRSEAQATGTSTSATPVKLTFSDKTTVAALDNNTAQRVSVRVIGRRTDTGSEVGAYAVVATVKRGANAGSTALVAAATTTTTAEDDSSWDATIVADTTTGGWSIQVTGAASKTIAWKAFVEALVG